MEILLPEDYFLPKLQLRPATAKQEHSQSRPGSPAALEESRSPKRRGLNWRGRLAANLSGGGSGSDSELGSNAGSDASGSPPERPFLLARYADAYSDASSSETDSPVSAGMTLLDPSSIHVSATPSTGLLPRGRDNHSSSSGSPDMRDTSQSNTATLPAQWSSAPQQQVEASEATVQALGAVQHFAGQSSVDWAGRQQYERESEAKPAALRQELHRDAVAAAKETAAQASLGSELRRLEQQLAEQEMLLQAYKAENEMAAERLRVQAADHKRCMSERDQQVAELQQAFMQAQERARQPPTTPAADAARLQEVLRLQADLQSVQAAAERRERELLQQVEEQRSEKQAAQHAAEAESAALQQAQQQLADSDNLVRQQARVISQLEQQLLVQDACSTLAAPPASNSAHQQQFGQLQNASALAQREVQAERTSGSATDHQHQLRELQAQLERQQEALALKEEQHQRQIRQLQREHERLRVVEGIRAASKSSAARMRELEQQLVQQQEASARKLRLLECKLKEASTSGKGTQMALRPGTSSRQPAPGPSNAPARFVGKAAAQHEELRAANVQLQQKEQRVRRLESELAQREGQLAALERRASHADARANEAAEREAAAQAGAEAAKEEAAAARAEAAALRQTVEEVTAANQGLQTQACQATMLQQQLAAQKEELAGLRRAEAALAALQQAQAEQAAAAQREMMSATEQARQAGQAAAAAEWRTRLEAAEADAAQWRANVGRLEADLRRARAGLPWAPSAADYAALERRMLEVEAAAQRREARWRDLAEAAAVEAAARQEQLAHSYEQALAVKEHEVGEFRRQLDSLLAAVRLLHAAGPLSRIAPVNSGGCPHTHSLPNPGPVFS